MAGIDLAKRFEHAGRRSPYGVSRSNPFRAENVPVKGAELATPLRRKPPLDRSACQFP